MKGPYDVTWTQYGVLTAGTFVLGLIIIGIASWRQRRKR